MTQIIDGKAMAAKLREQIARDVSELPYQPGLAVILVGEDPASKIYVRNKMEACEKAGIRSIESRLPADVTDEDISEIIEPLNFDPDVDGILIQLPLPKHLDSDRLIQLVNPEKDVDGLNFVNIGELVAGGDNGLVPCTPQGSLILIKSVLEDLTGMNALVIGRSLLFGKPMAQLLLQENCTVTMAHSHTRDLPSLCRQADILVVAVGIQKLIKGDWIKPGATVIDVGINRMDNGKLCGDVDFEAAQGIADA
ncbi:MAG: bifunctional methylenetetrahydrofolate dehydrogenase/methenyltetrahydrofolate cyclohydrolase, partial [Alphaproteobacteria bacterium]|nr:bifunctional methylenetetrahydrofolate dehydrogenase/methenyltetrahydrofolate cyclohydrolase [Alphaproteobacteria bacterium]